MFPVSQAHFNQPMHALPLHGIQAPEVVWFDVEEIRYHKHYSRDDNKPPTLKISYYCGLQSLVEWKALESDGFAFRMAANWWAQRWEQTTYTPTSVDEALELASYLRVKTNYLDERPEIYLYFMVAFWTGCRPSELIALTWQDVDFHSKQIYINKGRVNGVQQDSTKTNKARFVDLNDYAFAAFEQLQQLTYLKYEHVFICSETGERYNTQKSLYKKFVAAIKANRIRYRPAYNTRHTYATVCLMNGLNPVYVAAQLGHSLVMLTKRYARWINSEKNKEEIAKIQFCAKIVPSTATLKLTN